MCCTLGQAQPTYFGGEKVWQNQEEDEGAERSQRSYLESSEGAR